MDDFDVKTVNFALLTFKKFKKEKKELIRHKVRSNVRVVFGINKETVGKKFDKKINQLEEGYWSVSWARLYHYYSGEIDLIDWIVGIGTEMYVLNYVTKESKYSYECLKKFLNQYLLRYLNGLSYEIYQDKKVAIQKSEEALEKTIYNIMVNIHQYSPYKSGFLSWSYAIAKNVLLTPNEKTYELTDLLLDRESEKGLEAIIIDQRAFQNKTPAQYYAEKCLGNCLFETLYTDCGYPWQVLCTGLLQFGYKPITIVEKYADCTLGEIFEDFSQDFVKGFNQDEEWLKMLYGLNEKMQMKLEGLLSVYDTKSKTTLKEWLDQRCSTIPLKTFFGKQPNKNISDWNLRVQKRLKKALEKKGILD